MPGLFCHLGYPRKLTLQLQGSTSFSFPRDGITGTVTSQLCSDVKCTSELFVGGQHNTDPHPNSSITSWPSFLSGNVLGSLHTQETDFYTLYCLLALFEVINKSDKTLSLRKLLFFYSIETRKSEWQCS